MSHTNQNWQNTGLSEDDVSQLQSVFQQHTEVQQVWLFGSRAMQRHKLGSDIDFAVDGNLDFRQISQLMLAIDDLMLPYEVDILAMRDIDNPDLSAHIERVGRLFYKSDALNGDKT